MAEVVTRNKKEKTDDMTTEAIGKIDLAKSELPKPPETKPLRQYPK